MGRLARPCLLLILIALFSASPLPPAGAGRDRSAASDPAGGQGTAPRYRIDERLRPISPEQARAINLALAPGTTAGPPAPAFVLPGQAEDYRRALNCLTMAVYYEAGAERTEGQRAVAQVVLNRVRHPAFPNSVCGVVFQGSQRTTGCQFTFTCDGSRARPPTASGWARAAEVAAAALAGNVFPGVGLATHYHADYVLPYWASTLARNARVGTHIFYRWPGSGGGIAAFSQNWAGREPTAPPFRPGLAGLAQPSSEPPTTPREGAPSAAPEAPPTPRLRADENLGGLIADERGGELIAD